MAHQWFRTGVVPLLVASGILLGGRMTMAAEVLDHTVKGEVELGGRQIYGERGSSKFEEYREIRNGLFLDLLKLEAEDKEQSRFYQFRAKDAIEEDQNFLLRLGRYGKYEVQLEWDQLPHVFSNTGRSLFSGSGGGDLTISSLVRSTLQTASTDTDPGSADTIDTAAIRTTVNENVRGIDLRLRRDTGRIAFRYTPRPAWDLRLSYSNESREGTRPFGGNIGTNANVTATSTGSSFNTVELPEPIDYRTHDIGASAEYTTDWWSLRLGYAASIFTNDFSSFSWDNPFRTSDHATLGAARGRHAMPPDNMAHTISLSGAVNLPLASRFMGTISYGLMRQDESFLPHTTNSLLAPSALPAGSLDGKIDTLLMDYVLNTRPHRDVSLTARYRYYRLDNGTPELTFLDYVQADRSVVGAGATVPDRRNLAIEYTKHNAGLDVGWRPLSQVSVKAGYGWERYDRKNRDAKITDEHSGKGAFDLTPADWLLLRASYLHARRRYNEYDHEKFVGEHTFPAGEPATSLPQHPSLRKFDLADRDRNRVELLGQLTPLDVLTFTATFGLGKDDFKDIGFGITSDDNWSAAADIVYMPIPRLAIFANYTREEFKSKMRSRPRSTAAPTLDLPDNDWASDMKDIVDTVGAGVDLALIPKRLDLKLAYSYSTATGKVRTRPLGTPTVVGFTAVDYPDTKSRLHQLEAALRYHLAANFSAKLSYIYERYLEEDFATDVMQPYMQAVDSGASRSVFLGATQPNYEAHFVGLSVRFRF